MLCSHYDLAGTPPLGSPDTRVRAAHARLLSETGLDLHALGEIEFFLGHVRVMPDLDVLRERTCSSAQGPSIAEHRVPPMFEEAADAVQSSRAALESGGVFSVAMLDRVTAVLRA